MTEELEWTETEFSKKLSEYNKLGYPMCYVVSNYLEHKEKSMEEIFNIIETVKIPEYNARMESYRKNQSNQ